MAEDDPEGTDFLHMMYGQLREPDRAWIGGQRLRAEGTVWQLIEYRRWW